MKVLTTSELRTVKGINFCRQHIHKLIKAGLFPRPIHLSRGRVAFVESEIDAWLRGKVEERDQLVPAAA